MNYSDYQNMPSSEKLTLAVLNASKRLMGWTLHSGSIYKITNFDYAVIESIEDSGTAYTSVASIGAVTTSKYYLDRTAKTLYLRTTGSDNPNSRFIVATINLFFASAPIVLPYDLDTGFDVPWEPLIKSTSEFGVSIDTLAQTSEAIEGSGTLTMHNDFDFWPANFDKLSFENQKVRIYSHYRPLAPTEAQIIFKGAVDKQTYTASTVGFQLKDQFAELRKPIPLATIGSLAERTGDDLTLASQRMILGRVYGNVPTNIDQVLDGYPITGTITMSSGSVNVTGSGTAFLSELSPDDILIVEGVEVTIATVTSDTALTITEDFDGSVAVAAASAVVMPAEPKRWMNRIYKVAGHALREPTTTTLSGSNIDTLYVASTEDMFDGDTIYIGTLGAGEIAVIDSVIGDNYLKLSSSLATVPAAGTAVRRPAVQNVRINDTLLVYYRDYTFNATTAVLTLDNAAESNAAPIYQLPQNITITSGSRTVTGTGFQAVIKPGYMLGVVGQADFFEVLSVDSDTSLKLRTNATYTATAKGRYSSLIYTPGSSVLTIDVLGRTLDGTSSTSLLKTAPSICKALLEDAGLTDYIYTASFTAAEDIAYQHIGLVIPDTYNGTKLPTYRDVFNRINKSVFGSLVQTSNFLFSYQVLSAKKITPAATFSEADILKFSLTSSSENVVKTVIVEYQAKEYDYLTQKASISTQQKTSDNATYLVKTDRTKTISSVLARETDAQIAANRWAFLLQNSSSRLSFDTKLQGIALEVGDVIEVDNRKFFERFGSTSTRRVMLVESVDRSGSSVSVVATDLSNTFNRVACINSNSNAWADATESELLYGGYITDQYGLIDNDPSSFATNLIW